MTDANTLTPCPFCGERAETYFIPERHSYQIECSDVFGCTARVTRDSEQAAIEAWNLRAPAPASQPVGMEPVYQIGQPFPFDPENTWRDASKDAYDVCMPSKRRIIYTAAQVVQAILAAVPRNAPLYSPDDVAFPIQRSADGADALPPELASIAKQASIAAVEATSAPIKASEYPPLVCDYCGALTPDPWHSSGMLHGKMSKHIHSCDACAARGIAADG